jgi:succinate-semialdehyde dehydrogenase/glutarate-semialdehyde dehydrogenase
VSDVCTWHLFIDGVWRPGGEAATAPVIDPATEAITSRVAIATAADVDAAIDAAVRGFAIWRAMSPQARADVLDAVANSLAEAGTIDAAARQLTAEQGKTLAESRAEWSRTIETFRWCASAARDAAVSRPAAARGPATMRVVPEPIGVVAAFVPWNYPAVIAARKLGAALAAGCSIILKGAEDVPSAAVCIVRALESAGLPRGVVNLVFGDPPRISTQLMASTQVRAFTFTGSTPVGKHLAAQAAPTLKRCVLELGGHSPVLICADADLDAAAHAVAAYKFECAGQSCNAPSRVYVERSVYASFVDRLIAIAQSIRVGDGRDPATQMGPLANERRLTAMKRLIANATNKGAVMRTGAAERLPRRGYFWTPTLLTDVPDDAAILHEEPFGPVLPIAPFATFDEAIARANANPFGLASYVFTSAPALAARAADALDAGSIGINALQGVPPDVGIAGVKDSGYGYEGGALGIESFVNFKVVRG